MQETRMARGGRGESGAHTETLLCSDRFNVFVLQKVFSAPQSLIGLYCFYQNIHVLNVKWI